MTPKEKADELYKKMFDCIIHPELTFLEMQTYTKECALIAVDEILKTINDTFQGFLDADLVAYWNSVKQEIEKL